MVNITIVSVSTGIGKIKPLTLKPNSENQKQSQRKAKIHSLA